MKKKKQIMTAALLSVFCMSVTGCSLYQGNKGGSQSMLPRQKQTQRRT
ncbi:MAG: hypothetical protein V8T31_03635 [Lachnospiraceae bacterium]